MTLTTERQQFAKQNEMSMDFVNWFFDEKKESFGNMWFLMAAALWEGWKGRANREAQPVLYASEETLAYAKEGEKSLVTWSEPMGDAVIPLFTAPPAPAVVKLPTEFYSDEGIVVRLEQVMAALAVVGVKYERKGGACRAAMLAQPVSSGYTLPDGFKLMPLEMTDEIGEAIAMEARCCGGIALTIYEAALAAAKQGDADKI